MLKVTVKVHAPASDRNARFLPKSGPPEPVACQILL